MVYKQRIGIIRGYYIGYLVPTLNGEQLKNSIDRIQWCTKIFGCRPCKQRTVKQSKNKDYYHKAKEYAIRILNGTFYPLRDIINMREELYYSEKFEYPNVVFQ